MALSKPLRKLQIIRVLLARDLEALSDQRAISPGLSPALFRAYRDASTSYVWIWCHKKTHTHASKSVLIAHGNGHVICCVRFYSLWRGNSTTKSCCCLDHVTISSGSLITWHRDVGLWREINGALSLLSHPYYILHWGKYLLWSSIRDNFH